MIFILSSILQGDISSIMLNLLASIVVVFTALPIHEVAHGFVAYKLGDPTAKNMGRLNLNPFTHFDPIGTTMLIILGFGWAKPVPVNPYYFKNRKNGMALTALAGPVANILLATVSVLILKIVLYFAPEVAFFNYLIQVLYMIAQINITLAAFNLIPLPPLDGSKIIGFFMPMNVYFRFENFMAKYQQVFLYALMAILFVLPRLGGTFSVLGNVIDYPLNFLVSIIYKGINFITGFVDLIAKAIL